MNTTKQPQRNHVNIHDIDLSMVQVVELDGRSEGLDVWPCLQLGPTASIHFKSWMELEDFRSKLTRALSTHYNSEIQANLEATA